VITGLIIYLSIVIGGWVGLRPGPVKPDLSALYQYPTNIFFAVDRLANALIFGEVGETISSRAARHPGSFAEFVINIVMMDWAHGDRPGHCQRYRGL